MAPPANSSRHRLKVLARMKRAFTKYPDGFVEGKKDDSNDILQIWVEYEDNREISQDNKDILHDDIVDFIVKFCQSRYENMLAGGTKTIQEIDDSIFELPFEDARMRMWSMIDIWTITYKGPVPQLKDIASNQQSVHTTVVLKATNDGIGILSDISVPDGQKTLSEICQAWTKASCAHKIKIEAVAKDMKSWGAKPNVMHKTKNVYKDVLRGLWAKVKTYKAELYQELVKRLWEECWESIGLCADGHVGRLVNVLVGFDEEFKNDVSPMAYFQNNIVLIADASTPIEFKVQQAKKLMDEIGMPEEQRADWLEAL
jgi:hypothetical protein